MMLWDTPAFSYFLFYTRRLEKPRKDGEAAGQHWSRQPLSVGSSCGTQEKGELGTALQENQQLPRGEGSREPSSILGTSQSLPSPGPYKSSLWYKGSLTA